MRKVEPTGDPLFDRFWAAYPKKADKPEAIKAFKKLKVDEAFLEVLLEAIKLHTKVNQWDKPEKKKYIPHPATWLNHRRWEDELDGADTKPDTGAAPRTEAPGCCTVLE